MTKHWVRHVTVLAVIGALHSTASAQAWVADKGSLGLSLDYNFSFSDKVVTDTTMSFEDAGSTSHQVTLGVEYAPIDRLAISASLPFLMLKYTGEVANGMPSEYPHSGGGRYDDGSFHSTLTDFRAGVRYQVLEEPIAVAPHLAFSIPVADYETIGNTVAGRHLKMAHVGLSAGYIIGVATYLHLGYEFTLAEKYDRTAETEEYSQNRSDIAFTAGTRILDYRLDLHIGANMRLTHGGENLVEALSLGGSVSEYHDAILDEDVLLVGAGLGYDITDTLTATLDFRYFIEALSQNTLNASVLALGVSWKAL